MGQIPGRRFVRCGARGVEVTGVQASSQSALGYERDPELQVRFDAASRHLRAVDGLTDRDNAGEHRLVADLALEGGGVKGIGMVGAVLVLDEAGYAFRGVAGTSTGAIVASLVAGITTARRPMTELLRYMRSLTLSNFTPEGRLHQLLDRLGGHALELVADAVILTHRMGIHSGDYLTEWLAPFLHDDLGIRSFADLRLSSEADPDLSLPPGHEYRLVVYVSDITRHQLVRLPWDYPLYGHMADDEDPVLAVRASMSIPFFFEPVRFVANPADLDVSLPTGDTTRLRYSGGSVTWVDGGMLQNCSISAFDRIDRRSPRWPMIGVKLRELKQDVTLTKACDSSLSVGVGCVQTMLSEWDSYTVDEATSARTIFIDTAGIVDTDFDLTSEQQQAIFLNGVSAATQFVIDMASANGVPRTKAAALGLIEARRGDTESARSAR